MVDYGRNLTMTYITGTWGEQAQARSKTRNEYFKRYRRSKYPFNRGKYPYSSYQKERIRVKRDELISVMGGKCLKCGFLDKRALQIDHVHGGGSKERNLAGPSFYSRVLKSYLKNEDKYQLLCANCNFIKRDENHELARGGVKI